MIGFVLSVLALGGLVAAGFGVFMILQAVSAITSQPGLARSSR